jgi:hypothetical protein
MPCGYGSGQHDPDQRRNTAGPHRHGACRPPFPATDAGQGKGHPGHAMVSGAFPVPLCRKHPWPILPPPLLWA